MKQIKEPQGTSFPSPHILSRVSLCSFCARDRFEPFFRESKQRRRRRELGRQKINRFIKQNNNFARASHFFVHFFTVLARLRRENAQLQVLWSRT